MISGALYSTDTLSGGSFAFTDPNAGSGNKTVTVSGVTVNDGNSGGNYSVSYANNTTSTINPAQLTVTGSVTGTPRTYDGTTTNTLSGSLTVTGAVNSETINLTSTTSGTLNNSGNAGTDTVTAAATIGSVTGRSVRSPTERGAVRMLGTAALPVVPRSISWGDWSSGIPNARATDPVTPERLAAVSSTSRNGPLSPIMTGAQMRPIRSRRVGDT